MRKFLVATKNKGKLKEIEEILAGLPFEVVSMEQAGIDKDIEEYGTTFEENAMIKAKELHRLTGEMVMADDSGLEVDYLNGAPGIYSARFAGEGATDEDKNKKLLELLEGVPFEKRSARFVCVIAVVFPDGRSFTVKGTCDGYIGFVPQGTNGFGYDPLFFLPEYNMTTAQLDPDEKNKISHRGKALKAMVEKLKKYENFT
ncbi:non-canonical purine NTP pyrophosphatase [Clostridium thermosuccinogenes]|uniref:dITP/XTP pyrophosphatase n=1 Tax=Clostridium thermosuccinogenes TaxID=84032 RepID=A0A2K2FN46_9CLOT|nr:XTP/dITP diphosphatase [Pseudoclostridium thermosuccinogenes]AUS97912.1 non-canonical purine NTP pyrophosphatase [Pseudoclostridium thermosuccinogenes]PNU00209.1 non-canonical purine NTP pyrophosphatase [Pseudoclostridium thermosuccinogenes]PNU01533.1 non-canonical purine NTP pyrophosphatase [Pseudoclostridium thermosuccinogenes]